VWFPPFEKGNGGNREGCPPAPSSSWGCRQRTPGRWPLPTDKDVIAAVPAARGDGGPAGASHAAGVAASGTRGPGHGAKLVGTTDNRNAAAGRASPEGTGRSSRVGRRDAGELPGLFWASAYPRSARREESAAGRVPVGDSGELAVDGGLYRARWPGTSAGRASVASVGRLADKPHNSSGTAGVRGGTSVHSPGADSVGAVPRPVCAAAQTQPTIGEGPWERQLPWLKSRGGGGAPPRDDSRVCRGWGLALSSIAPRRHPRQRGVRS
jgi:hypothetical protein